MKRLFFFTIGTFLVVLNPMLHSCTSDNANSLKNKRTIYSEAAKVQPEFIPLTLGEITPKGWIEDWATDASNGITGHLDEYSATVFMGWRYNHDFTEIRGAEPGGIGWPLEIASNWLNGALRLSCILKDTTLFNRVSERLDEVVDGVLAGGESLIYWLPNDVWNKSGYNHVCHNNMGDALIAYYEATQDKRILDALVKVYKQYPVQDSLLFQASTIKPMTETFLLSGEPAILDSILTFSKRKNYLMLADNWRRGNFAFGHAVGFNHSFNTGALFYTWTGNKLDMDASLKALEWGEKNHLLPLGIVSGEEHLAGIGSTRNVETCNVFRSIEGFKWMLRITGDGAYADRIERIFFNAAPAPVARDFKTMCYYHSPNRYSNELPSEVPVAPGPQEDTYKFTKTGHSVQCCVSNLTRVIPEYISNMWMATMDNGLAATLYGPCNVQTSVGENIAVKIESLTAYPFEEKITITVKPEKSVEFPLYFRIPGWCAKPEIKINGTKINAKQKSGDFVRLSRIWKMGDTIKLHFPMSVKISKGRETPYPQTAFFNPERTRRKQRKIATDTTINNPYECIYYGPLLFSFPIPDENENQEVANIKYNYALDVYDTERQIKVVRKEMPERWFWQIDAPIQLKVNAREFNWNPTENQPIPKELIKGGISTSINLVPFGCAKFRVTMFPVTETSWNLSSDLPKIK